MKYINLIALFILTHRFIQPADTALVEEEFFAGPVEFIEEEYAIPVVDKAKKIKYTGLRHRLEPIHTPEKHSETNAQRTEKFKNTVMQEKAAKKIQNRWRSNKENQKIENFKRKYAATKLQQAARDYLKEKRIKKFEKSIKDFADQSYPKFKKLICTSDYLTKTDWIYQFIETMENKTIFQRNLDGTINPEKFTPEFEKQISNPTDWLDENIIQYLPQFHAIIYEIFINKAVEQIIKYKTSWTNAVSIPTPQGHGSLQEEGTPLFPKVYKCSYCPSHHLILARILTIVFEDEPQRLEQLNLAPTITPQGIVMDADGHTAFKDFEVQAFGHETLITISYDLNDADVDEPTEIAKAMNKHNILTELFTEYLEQLGLKLSPEEEVLASLIGEEFLEPKQPEWNSNDTRATWIEKLNNYNKELDRYLAEQNKFRDDHINWASSARQTFFLGQLIFDKSLPAFEALGGQQWLAKQPADIQSAIATLIENIKNKKQHRFKQKEIKGKPVHAKKTGSKYQVESLPPEKAAYPILPTELVSKEERLKRMKKNMQNQPRNLYRDLSSSQ